jgi:hypothetical protein
VGTIDDIRKLLQDLVTPDLKALSVRVEALEKRVDTGFADVKEKFADVTQTIADVDARAEHRHTSGFSDLKQIIADVDSRAERRHTALLIALHLEERVKRLEERAAPHEQRT